MLAISVQSHFELTYLMTFTIFKSQIPIFQTIQKTPKGVPCFNFLTNFLDVAKLLCKDVTVGSSPPLTLQPVDIQCLKPPPPYNTYTAYVTISCF